MFQNLLYIIPSFLIALSVHESAHALVAKWLGDPTGDLAGRISLNPLKHIDPVGTLLIFFVGFGWGKPVPVNDRYFKNRKRDNALVAFAGPVSNILLALIAFIFLKHLPLEEVWKQFLNVFISLNIILAVFNFLPVPPLDGGHMFELFVPKSLDAAWQSFKQTAPILLLGLLLAEHFFGVRILTNVLKFFTDIVYVFLYSIS